MPSLTFEVIYTMSRAATETEWTAARRLVGDWLARANAEQPALFAGAVITLDDVAMHVELAGSEDLIIERAGTVHIWSVRTTSADAARVLSGVLLCLQHALSAEVIQLSGSKVGVWQSAAKALTPVWGGEHVARIMMPRRFKADALVYLEHARNAEILRQYYRTQLELSEQALPDGDFKDTPLVDQA